MTRNPTREAALWRARATMDALDPLARRLSAISTRAPFVRSYTAGVHGQQWLPQRGAYDRNGMWCADWIGVPCSTREEAVAACEQHAQKESST